MTCTYDVRGEAFSTDERLAALAMKPITYLDIREPQSDKPAELVKFWRDETKRWITEYTRLQEEILAYNEFRDAGNLAALQAELASLADNVVEASWALNAALDRKHGIR